MRNRGLLKLMLHGLFERLQYPSLLIMIFGFAGTLCGFLGATLFGFPYLFWHEDSRTAISAGVAIGLFVGEWSFVCFLLDSDKKWIRNWIEAGSEARTTLRYLLCMNFFFVIPFLVAPFFYQPFNPLVVSNWARGMTSILAIISGLFLHMSFAALTAWLANSNFRWIQIWRHWLGRTLAYLKQNGLQRWLIKRFRGVSESEIQQEEIPMVWAHVVSGLNFFCILALGIVVLSINILSPVDENSWLQAATAPSVLCCVALASFVRLYGFLNYFVNRIYWFAVAFGFVLLVATGYFNQSNQKYRLPGIAKDLQIDQQVILEKLEYKPRAGEEAGFDPLIQWQRERVKQFLERWEFAPEQQVDTSIAALKTRIDEARAKGIREPKILALVATSGGGIRAQVWTVAALGGIESRIPSFPYHLRLVTGASGGMVGASYYVGSLGEPKPQDPFKAYHIEGTTQISLARLTENSSKDSLSRVARNLFYRDLPADFLPWLDLTDRGTALERAWAKNTGAEDSPYLKKMKELAPGERAGWRPSLVFSPSILETGQRLFISNLDVPELTFSEPFQPMPASDGEVESDEYWRKRLENLTISGIESKFLNEMKGLQYDMKLSTAARLNATFPFISPACALPIEYAQYSIGDAAYHDNYGVSLLAKWMLAHEAELGDFDGILIVQIISSTTPRKTSIPSKGGLFSGIYVPLVGLFSHANKKIVLSADELLEVAIGQVTEHHRNHRSKNEMPVSETPFVKLVTFEYDGQASLSWYLTPEEIYSIVFPFIHEPQQSHQDETKSPEATYITRFWGGDANGPVLSETQRLAQAKTRSRIQEQIEEIARWWQTK